MFRLNYNIFKASKNNDTKAVSQFLSKGIDPNLKDKHGRTALHYAVTTNDKDIVELLLDRGADIEAKDIDGETALHYAENNSNKKIVKFLEKRGALKSHKENKTFDLKKFATEICSLNLFRKKGRLTEKEIKDLEENIASMTPYERKDLVKKLKKEQKAELIESAFWILLFILLIFFSFKWKAGWIYHLFTSFFE